MCRWPPWRSSSPRRRSSTPNSSPRCAAAANPEGGIAVDVTELLDPSLTELAADALWSVPGLAAGAVDLWVPQLDSAAEAVVLGLDVEAGVVTHHLPALGEARDVAGAIVDQLLIRASR